MGKYADLNKKLSKSILSNYKVTPSDSDKLSTQINNYKTRLNAAGIDADAQLDKRNSLEKFLNLRQDQNILFDIFELLNRPQNALFSGIKASQEGGNFWEGVKQGISGNEDTRFKDILLNMGMNDTTYADLIKSGEKAGVGTWLKSIDLADILGLTGDIFLDPMNIPVAGFSKFNKALDAGEGLKAAWKSLDSTNDLVGKAAGKAIKGGIKGTDNLIEKGLSKLDEAEGIEYLNKAANRASDMLPRISGEAADYAGRLQNYRRAKEGIANLFKVPEGLKKVFGKQNVLEEQGEFIKLKAQNFLKEHVIPKLDDFAGSYNKTFGTEITRNEVADMISYFGEFLVNRKLDDGNVLKYALTGKLSSSDEIIETLNKILSESGIDNLSDMSIKTTENGRILLGKGWGKRKDDIMDAIKAAGGDEHFTLIPRKYTPEQESKIRYMFDLYTGDALTYDPQLTEDLSKQFHDLIDDALGTYWKKANSDLLWNTGDPLSRQQAVWYNNKGYRKEGDIGDINLRYRGNQYEPIIEGTNLTNTEKQGYEKLMFGTDNPNVGMDYATYYGDPKDTLYEGGQKLTGGDVYNVRNPGGDFRPNWGDTPVRDVDSFNAYKKISNNDRNKLVEYFNKADNRNEFYNLVLGDKDLVSDLKNLKIDVTNKDWAENAWRHHITVKYDFPGDNVDLDILYNLIRSSNGELSDDIINYYFMERATNFDELGTILTKSNTTGRAQKTRQFTDALGNIRESKPYGVNHIIAENILDPVSNYDSKGTHILELGNVPSRFKAKDNLTPILSNNIRDAIENQTPPKGGWIDELNKIFDEGYAEIGASGLSDKYKEALNIDYIMPHTLTEEGKSLLQDINEFINTPTATIGNQNILNSRTRLGSALEINNEILDELKSQYDNLTPKLKQFVDNNGKFMETNILNAMENRYLDKYGLTNVIKNNQLMSDVLLETSMGNYDDIMAQQRKIEELVAQGKQGTKEFQNALDAYNNSTKDKLVKFLTPYDKTIPDGYIQLTNKELDGILDKSKKLRDQLGVSDDVLDKLSNHIKRSGGKVAINKELWDIFDISSKESTYNIFGVYDKMLSSFKKWKTASPTFLLNNVTGNSTQLSLSGIDLADQAKYGSKVKNILDNGETLYTKAAQGIKLSDAEQEIADIWKEYKRMGFASTTGIDVQELSQEFQKYFDDANPKKLQNFKDYIKDGIPYLNNKLNNQMDTSARLTIMLYAKEHPSYLQKLGVNNIQEAISRVMFDPSMLTQFEQKVMKRIIPFYTYAKNNLVYHTMNMPRNMKNYTKLMNGVKSLQDSASNGDVENIPDYIKNSLYIPIIGTNKNGEYTVLRSSIPFGQISELADNPLEQLVNLSTPAVRLPFELISNKNFFTGGDLESYPGQKSNSLPFLTRKQEEILGTFSGFDVPIKQGYRAYQDISNMIQGQGYPLQNLITMQQNTNTEALNKQYEQIEELQGIINKYKAKGYNIATINELKEANKNQGLKQIQSRLNAINNKYK